MPPSPTRHFQAADTFFRSYSRARQESPVYALPRTLSNGAQSITSSRSPPDAQLTAKSMTLPLPRIDGRHYIHAFSLHDHGARPFAARRAAHLPHFKCLGLKSRGQPCASFHIYAAADINYGQYDAHKYAALFSFFLSACFDDARRKPERAATLTASKNNSAGCALAARRADMPLHVSREISRDVSEMPPTYCQRQPAPARAFTSQQQTIAMSCARPGCATSSRRLLARPPYANRLVHAMPITAAMPSRRHIDAGRAHISHAGQPTTDKRLTK